MGEFLEPTDDIETGSAESVPPAPEIPPQAVAKKEVVRTPEQREAELAISREIALSKYAIPEGEQERYEAIADTISKELVVSAERSGFEIPTEAVADLNIVVQAISSREKFNQCAINDDIIDIVRTHQGTPEELYYKLAESMRPFTERGKRKPPNGKQLGELKAGLENLASVGNDTETIEAVSNYNHLMKNLVEAHWSPGEGRERKELRIDNMAEVLDGIVATIIETGGEAGEVKEATAITAQDVLEIFRTSSMKVPKNFNSASVDFKRDIWFAMHTVARNHMGSAEVYEMESGPILSIATAKQEK